MARKKLFTIGYEQTPAKAVLDELESAGLTYWADRLDTGTLPQVLVPSFTNGPEYYGLTAKY